MEIEEIEEILKKTAETQNIRNYEVDTDAKSQRGNGFLGEFFTGSIKNKDTNEVLQVVVKKAFKNESRRENLQMRTAYLNEIRFYSSIIPTLIKFNKEKGIDEDFDIFAKYYTSDNREKLECLVLENIKFSGYDIKGRDAILDDDHTNFLFKTYGKLHALSFAYKDQHPEEYKELVSNIGDYIANMDKSGENFDIFLNKIASDSLDSLDSTFREKCKSLEKIGDIYREVKVYKGKYSCITHGDCWSNNIMFKYEDNKLVSLRLIDFQLMRESSPVYDLSYFLYAGGTRKAFDNLDFYLKLYYENFSKTLRKLGSDPDTLLPFKGLKDDWKRYSKFGIIMALMLAKIKLLNNEDAERLTKDEEPSDTFEDVVIDNKSFHKRARDILEHAAENGLLENQ